MGIILTEKGVQSGCATFLAKSTNLSAYRLKELESLFERAFPNVKGIEQLEDAIEGEQTTETALARLFGDNPHILLNSTSARSPGIVLQFAEALPFLPRVAVRLQILGRYSLTACARS